MNRNSLLFLGLALIVIGALGIVFIGYLPASWWGPGGSTWSSPMGNMMGGRGMMDGWGSRDDGAEKAPVSSNGERIYLYGESESGKPITSRSGGAGGHMVENRTCADCHGERRQGGLVDMMMMGSFEVPEITAEQLKEHGYTDSELKKAITEGLSHHDDEKLKFPMPRWSMAEEDLDDLVKFLKSE